MTKLPEDWTLDDLKSAIAYTKSEALRVYMLAFLELGEMLKEYADRNEEGFVYSKSSEDIVYQDILDKWGKIKLLGEMLTTVSNWLRTEND